MSEGQTQRFSWKRDTSVKQNLTKAVEIKQEPEEQSINKGGDLLLASAQREEALLDTSTEHHFRGTEVDTERASYPGNDYDLESFRFSCVQIKLEPEGDCHQFQIEDRSAAVQPSGLYQKYSSAPAPSVLVNDGAMPGIDQGAEMKKHECPFCQKRFDCKMNLKRHIRVHTGERAYSCSICQKTFTYKGNLVAHGKVHTGERPYSCSVCNNTFAHRYSLKEHMKTHTNEKPYSCPFCEKTFAHKGNLTTHTRIHTNEKPYKCSFCEKSFALKNTRDIHVRQHTGEKPYCCSLCDYKFCQSSHLYKHMQSSHTNKPELN